MADQKEYALQVLKVKIATAYRAKGTPDHRRLSELENQVFELLNPKRRRGCGNKLVTEHGEVSRWIAVECGGTRKRVCQRRVVSACGADAGLLWSKLERGELNLWSATLVSTKARAESRKSQQPLDQILTRFISEYVDRIKSSARQSADRLARLTREKYPGKANPRREDSAKSEQVKRAEMSASAEPAPAHVNGSFSATGLTKGFKANMLALVDQYLSQRLDGLCDPSELRQMIASAVTDVTVVCDEVISKVSYRRSNPQAPIDNRRVSRTSLLRACDMIGYRMPTRNGRPDMVEAKKRYRKLSARYHPDKTGGDERLTAQYRAVQESWKTIEQWNEENRS